MDVGIKNDSNDSANVADLMGQTKCQFYEYPEDDLVGLRNLLSLRKRLKKEEHRLRMQIRNSLLTKYFPEADCYLKNCAEEDLAVIRWYLDPRKIVSTDFKDPKSAIDFCKGTILALSNKKISTNDKKRFV